MSKSTATKPIRIGVAGLGRIGWQFHCAAIAKHPEFQLVAVADTDAARGREATEKYGCTAYATFDAMLDAAGLDAVAIATPTHLHRAMSVAALKRGLHVYLEKPMAPTLKDAQAIADAAKRAKRIVSVYQPHRAAAYYQTLRKLVADGRIGRMVQVRRGHFSYVRRDDWQGLRKFGGGMLNNYGAHFLDQVLNLTGSRLRRLFCQLCCVATLGDADDVVKIVYETRDRVLADLEINCATASAPYEFEVLGTYGTITMQKGVFTVRWFDPAALPQKALKDDLAAANRAYPWEQIPFQEAKVETDQALQVDVYADLARAIRTGGQPFVPVEETLAVMRIMAQCRASVGPRPVDQRRG